MSEEAKPQESQETTDLLELETESKSGQKGQGMIIGALLGFGIGMVFALGGFWAGVITIIFALVGAVVGKIFFEG